MNRSIFRPLEKWILGIVYGVALTSALATLVGAIHPLASERRPPRAIVQAARSLPIPMSAYEASTPNENGTRSRAGFEVAPTRYQPSPTEETRHR
jgi:hypothetical protein